MLTGRTYSARQAQRMGLVDRVLPRRQLEAGARDLLRTAPLPSRANFSQRLPNLPSVRGWVAQRMTRRTASKVRQEHYPDPDGEGLRRTDLVIEADRASIIINREARYRSPYRAASGRRPISPSG
ncbi:hypothetical protein [Thiocapsa sp.]|uniref:hypothetical protein n=1 Tax=Thiocapsa sp. TaxID=2024551 RepID=UPI002623D5CE|nr:hypothetical protein [Thiocapsa sp.]